MNNEKFQRYIIDIISWVKKLARKAKLEADSQKEGSKSYTQGVIMGYYSIIILLKREAFAFCIDQKELGLADIKPDVELFDLGTNPEADSGEDNWMTDVMSEEKVKGYLSDSITFLKEQAREAKKEADNPKRGFEDYNKGELMAYYSLFSLLKRQSSIWNIDEKELGLADIDPEQDLI